MPYRAPISEIVFLLRHVACPRGSTEASPAGNEDIAEAILNEAARFAEARLAPLNRASDRIGARFANGTVTTPPGFPEAYRDWAAGGWNGVDLPEAWGGMGLPCPLATATMEMWTSACMGFALGPVLTQAAAEVLIHYGSPALQATYVEALISGTMSATMNLTEPQAGSDLNALTTRAEPQVDGSYCLIGSKIFITYGEHDLTGNIVHLVLARLPDAPRGTRGLSLFLVPKFYAASGSDQATRNDVTCTGIEHKLGIHGSPTCTMVFGDHGGTKGWIIGAPNGGLAAMFTMMNKARLITGLQGVAIAERAYQQALAFAKTRRQGRAEGNVEGPMSLIIEHPDVRRNLMTMKALTTAGRALAYFTAAVIEETRHAADTTARAEAEALAGLLTPLVKAACSETGCEVTSLGVQIHGGMGYIEETGAAQHFRDARITPIYEGTNGIQAIDLVLRKVARDDGKTARRLIAELAAIIALGTGHSHPGIARSAGIVTEALHALEATTGWMLASARTNEDRLGVATPYLRLFAITVSAVLLLKGAVAAAEDATGAAQPRDLIVLAQFYTETVAVSAEALARIVTGSGDALSAAKNFDGFTV